MEEAYYLIIFAWLFFTIVTNVKHTQQFKKALLSLNSRGVNTRPYEPSFMGAGSGGSMKKIKALRNTFGNDLTADELSLLKSSERYYQANIIWVIPFVIVILWLAGSNIA